MNPHIPRHEQDNELFCQVLRKQDHLTSHSCAFSSPHSLIGKVPRFLTSPAQEPRPVVNSQPAIPTSATEGGG